MHPLAKLNQCFDDPTRTVLSEFISYLRLGHGHIADLRGVDHIAFIVALTAGYSWRDWRRLVWLVTAFTVGHSCTLILATLDVVRVPSRLVELLIAVTIVVTGAYGILVASRETGSTDARRTALPLYAMAGAFGLVHGLGFSTFLRAALGGEEEIAVPLFAFNVGLELGQLYIVGTVLLLGALACDRLGVSRIRWAMGLSLIAALAGVQMMAQRLN